MFMGQAVIQNTFPAISTSSVHKCRLRKLLSQSFFPGIVFNNRCNCLSKKSKVLTVVLGLFIAASVVAGLHFTGLLSDAPDLPEEMEGMLT